MAGEENTGLGAGDEAVLDGFEAALRTYASTLTDNFSSLTSAQSEDQLKAPVGALLVAAGSAAGVKVVTRTETRVNGIAGRPDIGVDADKLYIGSAELKAPGKGADPSKFSDKRSRDQFERFKEIPNLLYTDGRDWMLFQNGVQAQPIVHLSADPTSVGGSGITRKDAAALLNLLGVFMKWDPVVPSTPRALASMLAPLTRLLRDEVLADVRAKGVMSRMEKEWRATLFPDADDATFADGYAQTFTYGLLLARLEGAELPLNAETAARELNDDHALLAEALLLLGQPRAREAIGLSASLLERVIGAVDADKLNRGRDPWLYFYEDFLAAYDPVQRNNRGVYYTPFEVVAAQVQLCQSVLVEDLGKPAGFGEPDVVVLDPAVGTGTYPLTVASHAIEEAVARSGEGVRAQVATQLVNNVNAFELLVGPYAVSHLRLSRTFIDAGAVIPPTGVRVYLTDTLTSPIHEGFAEQATLFEQRLAAEQEAASRVKAAETRVTVIIGNPPYDRDEAGTNKKVRRKGGMIRYAEDGKSPGLIEDFLAPLRASGGGIHAKNLYNDYVYFWRWAIWKACQQHEGPSIVSFITASSYLSGPAFAGMREMMRREFDEIWLLDLGGDGRGTRQDDNVFAGVITPVVIAVAIRQPGTDPEIRRGTPAAVHYRKIVGSRDEKLALLSGMYQLDASDGWALASSGWLDGFIPGGTSAFDGWPSLFDLFPWQHSGMQFKRSWPIAETRELAEARWQSLLEAPAGDRGKLLRETGDRRATKGQDALLSSASLPALSSLESDAEPESFSQYGYRSFDRQWCISDMRLADRPRPELWATLSEKQIFLTTLTANSLNGGPAVTISTGVPDLHFFRGSFGAKDVIPLYRDETALSPNLLAGLLDVLSRTYGRTVGAEDFVAYVFGLLGTGAYTGRFVDELATSIPRVPLTSVVELFDDAVKFGRLLLWWGSFGARFQPRDDKGHLIRRLPSGTAKNTVAVSSDEASYPETFSYDEARRTIHVGDGEFGPVEPEVWNFEVSGLKVVQSWLGYRMKKRAGKSSSPLDGIRPEHWSFSIEFVEMLGVVEYFANNTREAAELLERVVTSDLLPIECLPTPTDEERKAPGRIRMDGPTELELDFG